MQLRKNGKRHERVPAPAPEPVVDPNAALFDISDGRPRLLFILTDDGRLAVYQWHIDISTAHSLAIDALMLTRQRELAYWRRLSDAEQEHVEQ